MGCTQSSQIILPKRAKYALRIAMYTSPEGKTASCAILYYQNKYIDYDAYRHDTKDPTGIRAYAMGLIMAAKLTATDLHVQTHHLELLSMLDDPKYENESIHTLESYFQNVRRSFIFEADNQDAISLCKYEVSDKIEPRCAEFTHLS